MVPLSAFYSRIKPYVVGCAEPTIDQALVDAAVRFCEDAKVIHAVSDPFTTAPGEPEYSLDAPLQQRVGVVTDVWCDGVPLAPLVGDGRPNPADGTGRPTHYHGVRAAPGFALRLFPVPDRAYEVVVDVAFVPQRSATALEDDLFDLWVEAVVAGTLSKLFSIPSQPYSDPAQAVAAGIAFNGLAMKARREAGRTRVEGSDRIRPRRFV